MSDREFPELFETPPTFISSPFQRGVIAKNQERAFFLGHPVQIQLRRRGKGNY